MKYVPIDATKKTGKKTSCMVEFTVSMAHSSGQIAAARKEYQ